MGSADPQRWTARQLQDTPGGGSPGTRPTAALEGGTTVEAGAVVVVVVERPVLPDRVVAGAAPAAFALASTSVKSVPTNRTT
jgi:hypothetical protein